MAVYFYAARLQAAFFKGFPHLSSRGSRFHGNARDIENSSSELDLSPDDDQSLVYEDGILISGSLPALVQHATPTAVYYPDTAYLFAFLLSARLFIKPHELLQRISDLGFGQQGLEGNDLETINKEHLGDFIPHMVQLLAEWTETFPYDFRDERMMEEVRTLTNRCVGLLPSLRRDVTQILHNLLNKLTQLERFEESLSKLVAPALSSTMNEVPDITEVCQSPSVMAYQLTHIDSERMSYISPEEFIQSPLTDLRKTSNIESYVHWFHKLSYLVTWQVCSPASKEQQVRLGEYWIDVASECFNICNYNSSMAIITGINMASDPGHKKIEWSKSHSVKYSLLEQQLDPSSNFSNYRSILRSAMRQSALNTDEAPKVIIPFFSLFVKDMCFFSEYCADRSPNGHIKFDKFWFLAKQVTEFMALKQYTCSFEKVPDVIYFLQTTPVISETGMTMTTAKREEPEK